MSTQADPVVEELIGLVFGAAGHLSADFNAAGAEHGLPHAQALLLVNLAEPMSMRAIADSLSCEPSNVTGIVDGLERRGLAVRQADPADRRVKQVVLTPEGKRTREALRSRGYAHAERFFALPDEVRVQLRDILAGILAGAGEGGATHLECAEPRTQKPRGGSAR